MYTESLRDTESIGLPLGDEPAERAGWGEIGGCPKGKSDQGLGCGEVGTRLAKRNERADGLRKAVCIISGPPIIPHARLAPKDVSSLFPW